MFPSEGMFPMRINTKNRQLFSLLFNKTGLLVFLLFTFYPSFAQEKKPFIPRTIDWGYSIIQGDSTHPHKQYILPIPIISYKPETRWILGVSLLYIFNKHKADSITRPSQIRTNISYSQERQFSVRPEINVFSRSNKIHIRALYSYTNFAEYYWGIGYNAPQEAKELYKFNQHKANLKVAYQFFPKLYMGIQYSLENLYDINYTEGGKLEHSGETGAKGFFESGAGFTIYYDDRDHVYFPYRGQVIELSNVFYNKAFGSEHRFMNITLDARKYIQLWKENVLAFQGVLNVNEGTIPFRMMGVLGSDMYMRGYYHGRYRDKHAMAVQAELRKTIWGPVGCVVFGGTGTVNSRIEGLVANLKPNIGFGIRVKAIPRERLNIRVDYGIGSDGNKSFYVTMNEAF